MPDKLMIMMFHVFFWLIALGPMMQMLLAGPSGLTRGSQIMKPVMIWGPARSRSTLFEKSMSMHSSIRMYHEVLEDCFYFGNGTDPTNSVRTGRHAAWRRSDLELLGSPESDECFESVLNRTLLLRPVGNGEGLLGPGSPSFQQLAVSKENSKYYVGDRIPDYQFDALQHVFLVRDPAAVIRSHLVLQQKSPDVPVWVPELVIRDWTMLWDIYERAVQHRTDQFPVVVVSDDLARFPDQVLGRLMEQLGLPFDAQMLGWEPHIIPDAWSTWASVFQMDVISSSGFRNDHPDRETGYAALAATLGVGVAEEAVRVEQTIRPIYDRFLKLPGRITVEVS